MKSIRNTYFAALAILLSPMVANANIIYDNGAPTTNNGYAISGQVNGSGTTTTDDFMLGNGASIGGVGFYFHNYNGITGWDGNISYAIRSDAGGNPGGVLASGSGLNVVASLSNFGWCCGGGNAWLITFDLQSAFAAAGGTSYWLELGGAGGPSPWWVTTGAGNAKYLNNGNVGANFSNGVSFYLTGAAQVPEPGTLALFGLGLAGIGFAKRKKA